MTKAKLNENGEEDENENTMKSFVYGQIDKFFVNHIPIDSFKDLPSVCKCVLYC